MCEKLADKSNYKEQKIGKKYVIEVEKIRNNIDVIKNKCKVPIYGVIKCDGYGMGLTFMAKTLKECEVDRFAISSIEDLVTLRNSGFKSEEILMLFSTCIEDELEVIVQKNGVATIGSIECAMLLDKIATKYNKKIQAHIKVDIGMGRYGFLYNDIDSILKVYNNFKNIKITGIYSHFNCAYSNRKKTKKQLNIFTSLIEKLKERVCDIGIIHIASSSSIFKYKNCYFDAVRIGSALVGGVVNGELYKLEKVGYLQGEISEIKWLPPEYDVGYGGDYRTKWSTKIAILPIGINDGVGIIKKDNVYSKNVIKYFYSILRKYISNKRTYVKIGEESVPILGQIGQNNMIIDITSLGTEVGDKCKVEINPLLINNNIYKEYV